MRTAQVLGCGIALCAMITPTLCAWAQADGARISAGEYTVELRKDGLLITHGGETISVGSYLCVFNPEYEGHLVATRDAWREDRVGASEDGRTVTLTAELPGGELTYSAEVSERGVRATVRVTVTEGAVVGPVEYAVFQIPPGIVEGGTLELWNAAGITTERKEIPGEPKRGGMAGAGAGFTIKTPARNIVISSVSHTSIYPFDGRVETYGSKQGLWPFAGPTVLAGKTTEMVVDLSVQPPDAPRVEGTIAFASGVEANAVATMPGASDREKTAAGELVEYLFRISGKRLAQIELAAGNLPGGNVPEGVLAVGSLAREAGLISEGELDTLGLDGYVVRIADGRGAICGARDLGTIYGAYALLRELGVKFYAATCEVVPEVEDLVIPDRQLAAKPIYEFRKVTQNLKLGHTPGDDIMNPRDLGEPGSIVHAAAYLLPFDMYHAEHPEYFALQKDGERLQREEGKRFDVHLCLSNPDVRRICAERLIDLIEKQKGRTFFGVSQGDGHAWCQCEECKALDAIPGVDMTDRLLDYVNYIAREVAKKHPDKRILTLAYTNATSPPPTKIMPEANVMVQYCPYPPRTGCHCHDLTCERNTQALEDLTGWLAKCPDNMYIFDYPCGYQNWYEPFGSFYAMKRKLDFYAANGIRGLFYCGTPRNFQDLFIFVQSRLHWEPNADVEALIDKFMAVYYGAAAAQVREYFDYLHREVAERPVHQMCEAANPGLVTPEYAEKALGILARAEAAAADDRASLYRVRAEKLCVLFADINERNPINVSLAVDEEVFARRLGEFVDIARAMRIGQMVRRKSMSDWLYQVARLRTEARRWHSDPMIDRLIREPAETLAREQQLFMQTEIEGGWLLELDGFLGCKGPEDYGHNCPVKRAVWIYGKNTKTPAMWVNLGLEDVPERARLVVVAQDDDKPGAVPIRISIGGEAVFSGPNPFKEDGWSEAEFPIAAGVLKAGKNEIRFETLEDSAARDAGWFMLAECKVLVE